MKTLAILAVCAAQALVAQEDTHIELPTLGGKPSQNRQIVDHFHPNRRSRYQLGDPRRPRFTRTIAHQQGLQR
jgi:hypothetical protein